MAMAAAGNGLVHAVFVAVGVVAGVALFAWARRASGRTDDRLWVIAGTCLAFGAIGSRVGTWWQQFDPTANESLAQWWMDGSRSVLAGLVGAWIGVYVGKFITGYRESTGDLFAPAVALAIGIGRIGCLMTELPGKPTGAGWGIVLTPAQANLLGGPADVGLHPTYLYEVLFQFAAVIVLLALRTRMRRPGDLFVLYVAAYAVFRFLVEFVRANEEVWLGLTRPQWFLLVVAPLLAWRIARLGRPIPVPDPSTAPTTGGTDVRPTPRTARGPRPS